MGYSNLFDLSGKVALITGATRGIGKAIAEAMAQFGAKVVISSRKAEVCDDVAATIRAGGAEALAVPCNVSHEDQLDGLVSRVLDQWKKIDVLVCNAAVNPHFGPMVEASTEVYDKIMDTNVKHVLGLCNRVAPQMASRREGAIIIISSILTTSLIGTTRIILSSTIMQVLAWLSNWLSKVLAGFST